MARWRPKIDGRSRLSLFPNFILAATHIPIVHPPVPNAMGCKIGVMVDDSIRARSRRRARLGMARRQFCFRTLDDFAASD
jgi:hypothetical protein